jgi:hypothetical protein
MKRSITVLTAKTENSKQQEIAQAMPQAKK